MGWHPVGLAGGWVLLLWMPRHFWGIWTNAEALASLCPEPGTLSPLWAEQARGRHVEDSDRYSASPARVPAGP